MRPVRLRSSRKFWPSDFFARQAVAADHLAQRRQASSRHAGRRERRLRGRRGEPRRQAKRGDQARRIGAAGAGDIEGGAVVGRGAHERQPERDVDGVVEGQRLDRDQRLVVIHGRARRRRSRARRHGTWCRPAADRARRCRAPADARPPGATMSRVLLAERAVLAGMRIEAGDGEPRARDAEAVRQGRARRCGRSRRSDRW